MPTPNVLPFRNRKIEPETLAAFFAAADRVFARAPWDVAEDSQIFQIDAPELGWSPGACACIIGSAGEQPGMLVFESLDAYVRFIEQVAQAEKSGETPVAEGAVFSINFDAKREVPKEQLKRAKASGLRPADPQGFPWLQRYGPRGVALEEEDDDYAFATALLNALGALLEEHPDLLTRRAFVAPLRFASAFEAPGRRRALELVAPHPDMPWEWGESAIEHFRWSTAYEVGDEYLAATTPPERSPEQEEALATTITRLFAFKIEQQDEEPLDFAPSDLEAYLLDYAPSHELMPAPELPTIPDRLASFLRWLGERRHIDAELASTLAADAERCREEFLARAEDPTRFGAAKRLALAMDSAGVDRDDETAVERFVGEYLERETASPSPQKKWTWNPGDPPPDPKGACPCGSGKRYKRCCLPR